MMLVEVETDLIDDAAESLSTGVPKDSSRRFGARIAVIVAIQS